MINRSSKNLIILASVASILCLGILAYIFLLADQEENELDKGSFNAMLLESRLIPHGDQSEIYRLQEEVHEYKKDLFNIHHPEDLARLAGFEEKFSSIRNAYDTAIQNLLEHVQISQLISQFHQKTGEIANENVERLSQFLFEKEQALVAASLYHQEEAKDYQMSLVKESLKRSNLLHFLLAQELALNEHIKQINELRQQIFAQELALAHQRDDSKKIHQELVAWMENNILDHIIVQDLQIVLQEKDFNYKKSEAFSKLFQKQNEKLLEEIAMLKAQDVSKSLQKQNEKLLEEIAMLKAQDVSKLLQEQNEKLLEEIAMLKAQDVSKSLQKQNEKLLEEIAMLKAQDVSKLLQEQNEKLLEEIAMLKAQDVSKSLQKQNEKLLEEIAKLEAQDFSKLLQEQNEKLIEEIALLESQAENEANLHVQRKIGIKKHDHLSISESPPPTTSKVGFEYN